MAEQIDPKTFFEVGLPVALEANKELGSKATGKTIQFDIMGKGGGNWTVDLSKAQSKAGKLDKPDLRVEINAQDFNDLMTGKLAGENAAATGRLRTDGNISLLAVLGAILGAVKT